MERGFNRAHKCNSDAERRRESGDGGILFGPMTRRTAAGREDDDGFFVEDGREFRVQAVAAARCPAGEREIVGGGIFGWRWTGFFDFASGGFVAGSFWI